METSNEAHVLPILRDWDGATVMEWGAEERHFAFSPLELILRSIPTLRCLYFFETVSQLIEVCTALLVMCNKVSQLHIMEFNCIL